MPFLYELTTALFLFSRSPALLILLHAVEIYNTFRFPRTKVQQNGVSPKQNDILLIRINVLLLRLAVKKGMFNAKHSLFYYNPPFGFTCMGFNSLLCCYHHFRSSRYACVLGDRTYAVGYSGTRKPYNAVFVYNGKVVHYSRG